MLDLKGDKNKRMNRVKDEVIGVRVSKRQLDKLDQIVEELRDRGEGLMVSRSGYLRKFIDVGMYLIKEKRYDDLINLVEME